MMTPSVFGAMVLSINKNENNVQISNFKNNAFVLTNTGDKIITSVVIDTTGALYPDAVFDPFGLAGDSTSKPLTINTNTGTGVVAPSAASYIGAGGAEGYHAIRLDFSQAVSGGFGRGESLGFSVDMDPNSVAGTSKRPLDDGSAPRWDVGGVSGAELIGSRFTVTFADGTTATGQLGGNGNQGGGVGQASQAVVPQSVSLSVNGLAPGGLGTYDSDGPSVIVSGAAGLVARVVLTKGFIQPVTPYNATLAEQLAALAQEDFPANNAVEFQTVDILLDGTAQDISARFDLSGVAAYDFAGEDQLPIGFVASIIDPAAGNLPIGPLTRPIYLGFDANPPGNSAPVIAPLPTIESGEFEAIGALIRATDADPADRITLTLALVDSGGAAIADYTFIDNGNGTGRFAWTTPDVPQDSIFTATVTASDGVNPAVTARFDVAVADTPEPVVVYRWNAGDRTVAAIDGGMDWSADTSVLTGGPTTVFAGRINKLDASVASTTPLGLFEQERWDRETGAEMGLSFGGGTLEAGDYAVRLFVGNGAARTKEENQRLFDVSIEGEVVLDDFDLIAAFGHKTGGMVEWSGTVLDGAIEIDFDHVLQNPLINGVEILRLDPLG